MHHHMNLMDSFFWVLIIDVAINKDGEQELINPELVGTIIPGIMR